MSSSLPDLPLLFSLTLCNSIDCSMPGSPVLHYLLEFAQTHVHWVSDAIQPSHALSSSSPPAFSLSQDQSLPMSQLFASGAQSIGLWIFNLPRHPPGFPGSSVVKNPPEMQEMQIFPTPWNVGLDDPLEKGMATHSSILAWEIPWTEELGRLRSMMLQRVGHDWVTK